MNKKLLYMLFVLVLGGVFFCLFLFTIHAQGTSSPISPKEIVIRAIQERAKADAIERKPGKILLPYLIILKKALKLFMQL